MKAIISVCAETNEVTIRLQELDWEAVERQSFYEGELTVQEVVRVTGQALTARLLQRQAVNAPQLEVGEQSYYRKAAAVGHYQPLYGPLALERHCYQTSSGGVTICPLEERCQLQAGATTPLLAEVISCKLASATAREVAAALSKGHALHLSPSYPARASRQRSAHRPSPTAGTGTCRWRNPPSLSPQLRRAWMARPCRWWEKAIKKRCAGRSRSMKRTGSV